MPYVLDEQRTFDCDIDEIVNDIQAAPPHKRSGIANYAVTRIALGGLKPETGWTYDSLANVIKTLECAKLEVYRRLLSLYEDFACDKNSDVLEFFRGESEIRKDNE